MLKSISKILSIVGMAVFLGMICLLPAQAANTAILQFPGADNPDNICSHGLVSIQAIYTPTINDFDGLDTVGIALLDGNGLPLGAYLNASTVGDGPVTLDSVLPLGVSRGAIQDITARPVRWRLYDTALTYADIDGWSQQQIYDDLSQNATVLATFEYDPAFVVDFCDTLPVPGYHFSRLDALPVCSYNPNAAVWHVRSYNKYNLRFEYEVTIPGLGTFRYPELAYGNLLIPQPYVDKVINTGASPYLPTILKVYVGGRLQDIAIHTRRNVC